MNKDVFDNTKVKSLKKKKKIVKFLDMFHLKVFKVSCENDMI